MARSERSRLLGEYLAALEDAKAAAENLGWRGDVSKINGMISATSAACVEDQRPELTTLGMISQILMSPL